MKIKNKFKKRHIVLIAGALICVIIANMCQTEKGTSLNIEEDLKELHEERDSVFNLADKLINDYNLEQQEIDSMSNILDSNEKLTHEEIINLEKLIRDKEIYIREMERDVVIISQPIEDTIIYNEIHEDIIIRDTLIVVDTIVEYFIIKDTVIQVDTIIYDPKDVKIKNRKKKN